MHQPLKGRDQSQSPSGRRDLPPPGQGAEGKERREDIISLAARGEGGSGLPAPLGSARGVPHPFVNTHFWYGSFSFD